MSINISELIWTVICFFVLLVVLKKLLFDPLVSFMAARDARIQDGLNAGRTAQRIHAQAAVVRESGQTGELCGGFRLDERVFLEGFAVFLGFGGTLRQRDDLDAEAAQQILAARLGVNRQGAKQAQQEQQREKQGKGSHDVSSFNQSR